MLFSDCIISINSSTVPLKGLKTFLHIGIGAYASVSTPPGLNVYKLALVGQLLAQGAPAGKSGLGLPVTVKAPCCHAGTATP